MNIDRFGVLSDISAHIRKLEEGWPGWDDDEMEYITPESIMYAIRLLRANCKDPSFLDFLYMLEGRVQKMMIKVPKPDKEDYKDEIF